MCARVKQPFEYARNEEFQQKLVDWIGDVLYDELPEHGYEVRDEQIYTAFQVAEAMCNKKVHFAEAGLGTGKTFAYLLSAIPYARHTGKPVVIACATSALQEQLAAEGGDVQTLSRLLGLEVDVRMAKDPNQYICDVRIEENTEGFGEMSKEINDWLATTKLGERSEMPTIPDYIWKRMKWEESMPCDICPNRGYCKLVKAREAYRGTTDLLIVDHETFFHDLWTREDRIANGKTPILPNYSAVIFDEGHRILLPAAMQAGWQINREEIDGMVAAIEEIQGARESLAVITGYVGKASDAFFETLRQCLVPNDGGKRNSIRIVPPVLKAAEVFHKTLDRLLLELQIEQELYMESLSPTQLQAFEGQIERAMIALSRFVRNRSNEIISWMEQKTGTFWVVPRNTGEMLNKQLYQKGIPVIFTSATLSNDGDFSYLASTIGAKNPSSSTIGSPFDMENQVTVYLPQVKNKYGVLASILKQNGGRALVLTDSMRELKKIRKALEQVEFPFELLWEDKADRGYLVRTFKEDETSVLIGTDFWEGMDVPGAALTLVVIWNLPLSTKDPLIEMQRKEAIERGEDPVVTVDFPEMGLKLKQGCGRLIRREEDKGKIVVLDPVIGKPWEAVVMGALPEGAKIKK